MLKLCQKKTILQDFLDKNRMSKNSHASLHEVYILINLGNYAAWLSAVGHYLFHHAPRLVF